MKAFLRHLALLSGLLGIIAGLIWVLDSGGMKYSLLALLWSRWAMGALFAAILLLLGARRISDFIKTRRLNSKLNSLTFPDSEDD